VTTPKPSPVKTAKRATSFEPHTAKVFGTIVRAERTARGVAQDEFALLANIDRSYFGKLERGERQPSLALIFRIAKGLELAASELLQRVEVEMRV
jgi:XRE family transcriptional regulator, regulator of sulfur utilization